MPAWRRHYVELVYVAGLSGASSRGSEGYFPQPPYLAHYRGAVVGVYHVYLIIALVGGAQKPLGREFTLYLLCFYRVNNSLIHDGSVCCLVVGKRIYRLAKRVCLALGVGSSSERLCPDRFAYPYAEVGALASEDFAWQKYHLNIELYTQYCS